MGVLEWLFNPGYDEAGVEKDTEDKRTIEKVRTASGGLRFTSDDECRELSHSMLWTLHLQKKDIAFIQEHCPMEGSDLRKQAEAMEALIRQTNNDQDDDVKEAFAAYQKLFKNDLAKARGIEAVKKIKTINERLEKWFCESNSDKMIDSNMLNAIIAEVEAIDKNVDESEKIPDLVVGASEDVKPILTDVNRDDYNILTLETEYRLKMMELMYLVSRDEYGVLNGQRYENPFESLTEEQQMEFASLLDQDMSKMANDYERLSNNEDIINQYGNSTFTQIDSYADKVNFVLDKQKVRDYSLRKMFAGEVSKDELFDFISKIVFIRYKLNNMQNEFQQVAERDKEAKEEAAERERIAAKEAEEEKKRAAEVEARRIEAEEAEKRDIEQRKQKEIETAESLKNATDEEIQSKIDELNHDVRNDGSRYVNIFEFQRRVAKMKGLLPEDDMVESDNLCTESYTGSEIIQFIKAANKSGVNYYVFPNSMEAGDGRFSVLLSNNNRGVFNLPGHKFEFGSPNRNETTISPTIYIDKGKRLGTVPGYFLDEVYRLYEESDDEFKEANKQFIYISKEKNKPDVYEIGYMVNHYDDGDKYQARRGIAFMEELIKQAYLNLQKQWKDTGEDRDVLCYLSIPATRNVLPVLKAFQDKGITPLFERTDTSNGRNTENRDNIHIYFRRDDLDKFAKDVVPVLETASGVQKVPYKLHYGKEYNFIEENSNDLHVKMLNGLTRT